MSAPTRVLLLCNSYSPEIGAAPLRMQGMAHLLRDTGFEVAVIAGMPNYPTGALFPQYAQNKPVTETVNGILVHRIPFMPSHSGNRWTRTGSLLSLSASVLRHGSAFLRDFQPQKLLISSPPLPLALCGAWLARKHKIPFLLNISDLWPLTAKELGALRDGPLYHTLEKAECWLFRQAQGWIGQSEQILHYLQTHSAAQKPHFLYRNLPPQNAVPDTPLSFSKNTPRRIVYAGLIGPVQGILEIVRNVSFAKFGLELHLYGDGADRKDLEAFLQKNPGCGVVYKGLLPPEEMFRILPQYDGALASLKTGIYGAVPSKIYTAMAARLPLFFLGEGEGGKIIQTHGTGWTIAPGDFAELEKHLSAFAEMPEDNLQALRSHISGVMEAHFNVEKQGVDFVRFFGEMF